MLKLNSTFSLVTNLYKSRLFLKSIVPCFFSTSLILVNILQLYLLPMSSKSRLESSFTRRGYFSFPYFLIDFSWGDTASALFLISPRKQSLYPTASTRNMDLQQSALASEWGSCHQYQQEKHQERNLLLSAYKALQLVASSIWAFWK